MQNSGISWTDSTFNGWIGCTKVSPGCKNCYAEHLNVKRFKRDVWGVGKQRQITSDAIWRQPRKWNREAEASGLAHFVFCSSLCDVMDDEAPAGARERLWQLVYDTPHLTWLLLTKRPQNFSKYLPWGSNDEPWPHAWLGTSTEDVRRANERLPHLLAMPATVHFISAEPLLEDISGVDLTGIDWTIVGGESGSKARPMDVEWVRNLKASAEAVGSKVWVKQMGQVWAKENRPSNLIQIKTASEKGKPAWSIHGADISKWDADLRVQEWPVPAVA